MKDIIKFVLTVLCISVVASASLLMWAVVTAVVAPF